MLINKSKRWAVRALLYLILLILLTGCNLFSENKENTEAGDPIISEEDTDLNWWEEEHELDAEFVFDPDKEFEDYSDQAFFDYMFQGLKAALVSGDPGRILELTPMRSSDLDHYRDHNIYYSYDYEKLESFHVLVGEIETSEYKNGVWEAYAKAYVKNGCSLIPEGEQILYAKFSDRFDMGLSLVPGLEQLTIGTLKEGELFTRFIGEGKYADPDFKSLGNITLKYFPASTYTMMLSLDDWALGINVFYGPWMRGVTQDLYDYPDPEEVTPEFLADFAEKYLCIMDYFDRDDLITEMKTWDTYDHSTGTFVDASTEFYGELEQILNVEFPDEKSEVITILFYDDALCLVPGIVYRYTFEIRTDEDGEEYAALKKTEAMLYLDYLKNEKSF